MPLYPILLGFDFGTKRIGVAVGQTFTQSASTLPALKARGGIPDWGKVTQLIQEWQPVALVVGIPLNMDGTEQPITHAAQYFVKNLQERYQLKVFGMDERLSTADARERLFNYGGYKALQKNSIDSVAAQLILSHWLTHHADELSQAD